MLWRIVMARPIPDSRQGSRVSETVESTEISGRGALAKLSASCPGNSAVAQRTGQRSTVGELIDLVAYLRTLQAKPNLAGAASSPTQRPNPSRLTAVRFGGNDGP